MKLVITEQSDPQNEISFSADQILVGHELAHCHLHFAHSQWPMVAARHAEFLVTAGECRLFELTPGAGTFVDGKTITKSAVIRAGARIQFGLGGPLVTVVQVELYDSQATTQAHADFPVAPQTPGKRQEGAQIVLPAFAKNKRSPVKTAYLEVVGDFSANVRRLELNKDIARLGREPELDIVFDAGTSFISRKHAAVGRTGDGYVLTDLDSFNGTLLNGKRITSASLLRDGDSIQLGMTGPTIRFYQGGGMRLSPPIALPVAPGPGEGHQLTTVMVDQAPAALPERPRESSNEPVQVVPFAGKSTYTIGRTGESDVKLDGLQISKQHARLTIVAAQVFIEDNHSTNGVYVNGLRLMGKMIVNPNDRVQIGPFELTVDLQRGISVFDTRAQMRIDSVSVTKVVRNNVSKGTLKLLDSVSLTIQPNQFVGLLGPSGAGKSTFIDALNGMRPATAGQVLINNLDLYQHLDWLKQSIGYVPQDDIMHRELSVYRTLYYVAKLRLSNDVSEAEVEAIINEVLDLTGLAERRSVPVAQLSGGQRKRVSVAVELLTKPSVIFLDEPTSGLDPATEEKIMVLFRQIADSGHTVVLTTHAMDNVRLFDKIIVMMQGKLVFYGTPQEALAYLQAKSFKDLYDKLEAPIGRQMAGLAPAGNGQAESQKALLAQVRESVAETWKQSFLHTPQYENNVRRPQTDLPKVRHTQLGPKQKATFKGGILQWKTLCQRYAEVLGRDKINLLILFGQAPLIAFLTWLAVGAKSTRDFPYFILSLVPIWFGTSVAAREVIRERAIYHRERMVNLGLGSYVTSKLSVLSLIVTAQCVVLFVTLKLFTVIGFKFPGQFGGLPHLFIMILTGIVGIALGLLVSASVKTSEMATSFVPLLLIPQILFCGLIGVPEGVTKAVGAVMPATWAFDEMKRLSDEHVKVLRGKDENAEPAYYDDGEGLYHQTKLNSDKAVKDADEKLKKYKDEQQDKVKKKVTQAIHDHNPNPRIELDETPAKPEIKPIPEDLSDYVNFLHPWGSLVLNPLVLFLMFSVLVACTVAVLRSQDVM